jgi:hypothetical protein
MNVKDIPAEVFQWLFEQQAKGEHFAIYVLPDCVITSNGLEDYYLVDAYKNGTLLSHLGEKGYTEKSWSELDEYGEEFDEFIYGDADTSENDTHSDSKPIDFDFLERTGLWERLLKSIHIVNPPKKKE